MANQTEVQSIVDVAQSAMDGDMHTQTDLDGMKLLTQVVPEGATLHDIDLEQYHTTPDAKRGILSFDTAGSLTDYVNAHKTDGTSVYGDVERQVIVAVLDGHVPSADGAGTAGWGRHRAEFTPRKTPEWNFWLVNQGMKAQVEFADIIEDGQLEIYPGDNGEFPAAVDMLTIAKKFRATKAVQFHSDIDSHNGSIDFRYEEKVRGQSATTTGTLTDVPEIFAIRLAPFRGSPIYQVQARLKYRVNDSGGLAIGYQLIRPDRTLEAAFQTVLNEVAGLDADGTPTGDFGTGCPTYLGRPPAAQ